MTNRECYGTVLNVKIIVYDFEKSIVFDVYEDILVIAGKRRISVQLLQTVESYEGTKVDVYADDGYNFTFDQAQLLNYQDRVMYPLRCGCVHH